MWYNETMPTKETAPTRVTYQYYFSRIFKGPGSVALVKEFSHRASEQCGCNFVAYSGQSEGDEFGAVDLEKWPDDQSFGPWFDELMYRYEFEVID